MSPAGTAPKDLHFYSWKFWKHPSSLKCIMNYVYDLEPKSSVVKENYAPTLAPHTLLHKLVTGQYQEYLFGYMLTDGVWKPALGGGYQVTEDGVAILTRLFVVPHYRMRLFIQHLLAELVRSLSARDDLVLDTRVYLTFNSYNAVLYEWFVRRAEGRGSAVGKQWPEVFSVFKPAGLQMVNSVEQFVCETTWGVLLNEVLGPEAVRRYEAVRCAERRMAGTVSRRKEDAAPEVSSSYLRST